jgi:predicted outer membrane repeat protein
MFSNSPQIRQLFVCVSAAALLAAMALFLPSLLQAQTGTVIYVRSAASGAGDGSSWADATTLQDALQNRVAAGDEIWLAGGVYSPGPDPLDTFELVHGVAVYGGFAGSETAREQRDPAANLTVFSGDIAGDDRNKSNGITPTSDDIVGTNTRNIVRLSFPSSASTPSATLAGVTVTGGQANTFDSNWLSCPRSCGGAMDIRGNLRLADVRFIGNQARRSGGALYLSGNVTGRDLYFSGNRAEFGGAVYVNLADPTLSNVVFENNRAQGRLLNDGRGGAIFIDAGNVTINGGRFSENVATETGGAIFFEDYDRTLTMNDVQFISNRSERGTSAVQVRFGNLRLTNGEFSGNIAEGAGALNILGHGFEDIPPTTAILTNASFHGNRAETQVGAILCNTCRLIGTNLSIVGNLGNRTGSGGINTAGPEVFLALRNSVIWGNRTLAAAPFIDDNFYPHDQARLVITNSLIEGFAFPGAGNLDGTSSMNDPRFVAAPDPFAAPTTAGDLQLQPNSPLIDAGDNGLNDSQVDVAGNPRIGNTIIDIGAYELGAGSPALRMAPASDSGIRNNDNITNNTSPTFIGTVPAGSTVTLSSSLDGALGNTTADGNGGWQLATGPLREGQHQITAGIDGNPVGLLNVQIDTTRPTLNIQGDYIDEDSSDVELEFIFSDAVFGFEREDIAATESPEGVFFSVLDVTGRDNFYQATIIHRRALGASGQMTIAVADGAVTDAAGNPNTGDNINYDVLLPTTTEELCAAIETSRTAAALAQTTDSTSSEPLNLGLLYDTRDRVMRESAEGRRLIDVYYENSDEIARLMLADLDLMMQGVEALRAWQPELRALTSGTGDRAVISEEQVQATNAFLDALSAAGSPELQQMLSQERATIQFESLVGQTMNEATQNVIDVDPAELDLGEPVFLPFVTRW